MNCQNAPKKTGFFFQNQLWYFVRSNFAASNFMILKGIKNLPYINRLWTFTPRPTAGKSPINFIIGLGRRPIAKTGRSRSPAWSTLPRWTQFVRIISAVIGQRTSGWWDMSRCSWRRDVTRLYASVGGRRDAVAGLVARVTGGVFQGRGYRSGNKIKHRHYGCCELRCNKD